MKNIWIITLFPEFFEPLKNSGVIGQALRGERKTSLRFNLEVLDLREFSQTKYKGVDDSPFGGGEGMVLKADVLFRAMDQVRKRRGDKDFSHLHTVYTSPRGKVWDRNLCHDFSQRVLRDGGKDLIFICGRYEGVDERFLESYVDEFISLGDYVLSGGEIPVMSILDSALRFIPGVLGNDTSAQKDSFENGLLEHPQYTRPREFQGKGIPPALLSGHHLEIEKFQKEEQEKMTKKYRPDLWEKYEKTKE